LRPRFVPNTLHQPLVEQIRHGEGKPYLCAIKDVYSNRIIGYSIDSRMKARLAVQALDNAVARRRIDGGEVAGCILHSDRGSQFRSRKVQRALTRYAMVGSIGQVASAADNAAMESFFSLLQNNVLDRQSWRTREQLRIAIVTWIERTYHRRRRQVTLGRLTPLEYEAIMTAPAARRLNQTCLQFVQQAPVLVTSWPLSPRSGLRGSSRCRPDPRQQRPNDTPPPAPRR
jgi:transposase InsO family protein